MGISKLIRQGHYTCEEIAAITGVIVQALRQSQPKPRTPLPNLRPSQPQALSLRMS